MTEFNLNHDETKCVCCMEPIRVGMYSWLDIRTHIPHGDSALLVLLYHNWILPDTAYIVFGQTYRILGLYPPNPLLALLMYINEDEKSQA